MFGKAALTKEKSCGGLKARGQIHNVHSITEGLVVAAVIFISEFKCKVHNTNQALA